MNTDLQCPIQSHRGKQITTVCLDKTCKQMNRLCCLLCQKEFHNNHLDKLIEVSCLNKFIQQECKQEASKQQSSSQGQEQQIKQLRQLITMIDIFKKVILERIDNIQQRIRDRIVKIQQSNFQYFYSQMSNNSQQGISYWNHVLQGIIQYVEIDNCDIKLKQSIEGLLNKMEEQEIQIIQQSEKSLQFIINQITQPQIKNDNQVQIQIKTPIQMKNQIPTITEIPTQIMKIEKLYFDENRKHKDIVIIDQSIIKKINSYQGVMVFANEGFDPKNQSYDFAFDIQNGVCYLLVGVGNEEGRIAPSYLFDDWSLGHGLYMMCGTGRIRHHTDNSFNCKERGMRFETGDKIQIKYDHITKVLEFRKSSDQTVVTMPITDMTKKLYPCAMLYHVNEQVQLVEY